MRIVIDLQAAQSPGSRNRGIGRYSMALAKAMLRHRGGHEILIALNGMFADTVGPLREAFRDLIPDSGIRVWHATIPPYASCGASFEQRRAAELVREAFLESLEPDVVHVASLFESSAYAVSSVGGGRGAIHAVTLYDLIPHLYPGIYLPSPQGRLEYEEKIAHLRRADLLLSISEASRNEAVQYLGLEGSRVVNISSAADPHFSPAETSAERERELRERHGLARAFVMYTGGIDHRKNVEGLISAWASLPAQVRATHQLAVICAVETRDRTRLEAQARALGLGPADVILTGFVSEEDLRDLYRLCKLFVFPSMHEGFGLPALEAMSCGAAVIGADNSSIPEVIGRPDALFDASSTGAMASAIERTLCDGELLEKLKRHGVERARHFSWDASARTALRAMEQAVEARRSPAPLAGRPRLALVSPLPPQRSGIADSSADLLPELARHYDIDVVVEDGECPTVPAPAVRREAKWFMENGHLYDRVVYQFGNSAFHEYQFDLLQRHPGVVILHDFYLSGVVAHREFHSGRARYWARALYESHGWHAVAEREHSPDIGDVVFRYPANFGVLQASLGVVVHSAYAARLAREWFGPDAARDWAVVPLLRPRARRPDRAGARARLGLPADGFVTCSFGHLGPTKLNERMLAAWRASPLAQAPDCRLCFVGELQPGPFGRTFGDAVAAGPDNVKVTGWVDSQQYEDFLDAADVAVQLRTLTRGETSAAVLDCLNHGVATIVNATGSMQDLDPGTVRMLPVDFTDEQLAMALTELWRTPGQRREMSKKGYEIVHTLHDPAVCADAYAVAIERFHAGLQARRLQWIDALAAALGSGAEPDFMAALARAFAQNMPARRPGRQLVVDVTPWMRSGPQASDTLLGDLIRSAPRGWRCEPVYEDTHGVWRYARDYTLRELLCPADMLADDPVDLQRDDVWTTIAPGEGGGPHTPARATELNLQRVSLHLATDARLVWACVDACGARDGRRQWFVDVSELVQRDAQSGIQRVVKNYLMELLLDPPDGIQVVPVFATGAQTGYRVARGFAWGLAGGKGAAQPEPLIDAAGGDLFFGLDLQPHVVPAQAKYLEGLAARGVGIAFMVYDLLPIRLPGCFVPGGAQQQELWLRVVAGADQAICISGAVAEDLRSWLRETGITSRIRIDSLHLGGDLSHALPSWGRPPDADALLGAVRTRPSFLMVGTLEPRKSHAAVLAAFELLWAQGEDVALVIVGRAGWMVEPLVDSLRQHPQRGKRLFWVEDGTDEFLQQLYVACGCLIAASQGEGFGLPLLEAARTGLPIIARDLPVFREVAGTHAFYFDDDGQEALAARIGAWLELQRQRRQPSSAGMPWLTWKQSAQALKDLLLSIPAAEGGDRKRGSGP